ncbi:MAG: hypothetical protein ACRYGK_03890 [Janthinobacterium lividum]
MASTHVYSTIIATGTSNAAGATTTGAVVDLTTKYGAFLTAKITNGATAPTVAPNVYVYTSGNGVDFKLAYRAGGDTVAGSVTELSFDISERVMYVRLDVRDNTGQAVTCEAFAQILATI